jgi:hypothetical protein
MERHITTPFPRNALTLIILVCGGTWAILHSFAFVGFFMPGKVWLGLLLTFATSVAVQVWRR